MRLTVVAPRRTNAPHGVRLRHHDGFRVAADVFQLASAHGAAPGLLARLWTVVVREAGLAEKALRKRGG